MPNYMDCHPPMQPPIPLQWEGNEADRYKLLFLFQEKKAEGPIVNDLKSIHLLRHRHLIGGCQVISGQFGAILLGCGEGTLVQLRLR